MLYVLFRHPLSLSSLALTRTRRPQHAEKLHIARQSLLPKQLRANALEPSHLSMSNDVLLRLVTAYTREAGVRSLERALGSVCRAKAVELAESDDADSGGEGKAAYVAEVTEADLERILGPPRWEDDEDDGARVGVSTGLAYQGSGNGGILRASHFLSICKASCGPDPDESATACSQTSRRRTRPARAPSPSRASSAASSPSRRT